MKEEVEKKLLRVVKKVVDVDVHREKYGDGHPYCPVIFYQLMRPQKKQKYQN